MCLARDFHMLLCTLPSLNPPKEKELKSRHTVGALELLLLPENGGADLCGPGVGLPGAAKDEGWEFHMLSLSGVAGWWAWCWALARKMEWHAQDPASCSRSAQHTVRCPFGTCKGRPCEGEGLQALPDSGCR